MKKNFLLLIATFMGLIFAAFFLPGTKQPAQGSPEGLQQPSVRTQTMVLEDSRDSVLQIPGEEKIEETKNGENLPPLYIDALRSRDYPASPLLIEETLDPGENYQRHIASFQSDGSKVYGLLTIPEGEMPEGGFPAILFLHGYIPPDSYVTTADYVATQDGLARSGFVTFKPDMRGHGRSEGTATGAHFSETYIVDALNALSSMETFYGINPERIGQWGHSNGGLIGLRVAVVTDRVRASVFWGGVVGSYEDMLETYFPRIDFLQRLAPAVVEEYGLPSENREYWDRIDPFRYLDDITSPIQLHHGTSDDSVPSELSESLGDALAGAGKEAELYLYEGAGHNLYDDAFSLAMSRTVAFFNTHLE